LSDIAALIKLKNPSLLL